MYTGMMKLIRELTRLRIKGQITVTREDPYNKRHFYLQMGCSKEGVIILI